MKRLKPKKIYNINEFNAILEKTKNYPNIDLNAVNSWKRVPPFCRFIECGSFWIDITYCELNERHRVQLRFCKHEEGTKKTITGSKGFRLFEEEAKKYGINMEEYATNNGAEIKKTIPPLLIKANKFLFDQTLENAHHIDFHSSFPAGLVNAYPEFRPVIEHFYKGRKEHEEYKTVLNSSIGYMQSKDCCNAKWAHLSKAAIIDNNKRLREMAQKLIMNGNELLAYNTDGIWYMGDIYHGEGEGKNLGQWENDHVNCTIRFKSAGSYEYIENGIYTPVVRGLTTYDIEVPREQWVWGDIYKGSAIEYIYLPDENKVIMKEVDNG